MTRPGPLWTRARLTRVMRLRFGAAPGGGVDTAAVAIAMEVSRRSVQRWLQAPHPRSLAPIPPRRLEQLLALLSPAGDTLAREAQQARYAAKAIDALGLARGMGIKPAWRTRRWLEPHLVAVLEVTAGGQHLRQLAVTRLSVAKTDELARRGRIVDQAVVPTRFHATALVHQTLTDLAPWRYLANAEQVAAGYTQAWFTDAPATHLTRLADALPPGPVLPP